MELQLSAYGIALIPIIVALVGLAKKTGLRAKWAPWAALILGVGAAFVYVSADWRQAVLAGIVMGLASSGLYSAGKATTKGE